MELKQWRRRGASGFVGLSYDDTRGVHHDGKEFSLLGSYACVDHGEYFLVQGPLRTWYKLMKTEELQV